MNPGHLFRSRLAGRAALRAQRWAAERRWARQGEGSDRSLNPPLRSTIRMRELMSRHYLEGRHVEGVKPVAWVTRGAPTELL